jgi:hypothetical protein
LEVLAAGYANALVALLDITDHATVPGRQPPAASRGPPDQWRMIGFIMGAS